MNASTHKNGNGYVGTSSPILSEQDASQIGDAMETGLKSAFDAIDTKLSPVGQEHLMAAVDHLHAALRECIAPSAEPVTGSATADTETKAQTAARIFGKLLTPFIS